VPLAAADPLASLAQERERFLREGTLADTFAVVYFPITRLLLETAPQRRFPELCRAQVAAFFSVYAANRQTPDPHWQPYYALAHGTLKYHTDPGKKLNDLLLHGLHAHITVDLPQVLRATKPAALSWDELYPDFCAEDALFAAATRAALGDFDRATRRSHGLLRTTHRPVLELGEWLLGRFGEGTAKVRRLRHTAWNAASQDFRELKILE